MKTVERVKADCTERPQIGKMNLPELPHQKACEPITETGLRRERTGFPIPSHARTDHHVGLVPCDGVYQSRGLFGIVTVIAIHKQDDVRILELRDASQACRAVPAVRLADNIGSVLPRNCRGAVCRAVVRDYHLVNPLGDSRQHFAD